MIEFHSLGKFITFPRISTTMCWMRERRAVDFFLRTFVSFSSSAAIAKRRKLNANQPSTAAFRLKVRPALVQLGVERGELVHGVLQNLLRDGAAR